MKIRDTARNGRANKPIADFVLDEVGPEAMFVLIIIT